MILEIIGFFTAVVAYASFEAWRAWRREQREREDVMKRTYDVPE